MELAPDPHSHPIIFTPAELRAVAQKPTAAPPQATNLKLSLRTKVSAPAATRTPCAHTVPNPKVPADLVPLWANLAVELGGPARLSTRRRVCHPKTPVATRAVGTTSPASIRSSMAVEAQLRGNMLRASRASRVISVGTEGDMVVATTTAAAIVGAGARAMVIKGVGLLETHRSIVCWLLLSIKMKAE